jgi:hypothetical protein
MLQVYLLRYCICFINMLQAFYLDVTYVLQWFLSVFQVFLQVFQLHILSVSSAILQVFHLNVSKVDRVLHLPPCFMLPRLGVSSSSQRRIGHPPPPPPLLDASNVRGSTGLRGRVKWHEKRSACAVFRKPYCSDVRALASLEKEGCSGERS